VAHLQKQITKIRQDERRLIELFVGDREQQELVQAKLRALAKQKAGLAEHLQRAKEQAAKHGTLSRLDAIERLCEQARRGLDRLDHDGRRNLLLELVDEIKETDPLQSMASYRPGSFPDRRQGRKSSPVWATCCRCQPRDRSRPVAHVRPASYAAASSY
jgi:hypothetical protein